ncbi:PREDICTED: ankyrin repeat domain-containing protein 13B-like, partial [Thamnophis sirtalis]|uniref:Ankyrin repeat domain-containing protein 13B-like n=1 Tax=Thamnophis sirtalis TaxID=35019 RepID=A0A6I9YT38_9SAUR
VHIPNHCKAGGFRLPSENQELELVGEPRPRDPKEAKKDSNACFFEGQHRPHGSRWAPDYDKKCSICICQKRTVICDPVLCQPLNCSQPVHQSDQCCPVCQEENEERKRAEKIRDGSEGGKTPLQSFLGIAEQHVGPNNGALITQTLSHANPTAITPEEYFNPNFELGTRDMGRPVELTTKTQKFKAKLWLCEDHPLSLAEQVAPIIDLMAVSNALFAKLRDFITLRLPPGFPVKIEIPIFHILNARITFGNLNGCDEPVVSLRSTGSPSSDAPSPGSDRSSISSSSSLGSCRCFEMDPSLFEAPQGYSVVGRHPEPLREDEDDLLQFAIQQSLLEAGSEYDQVTIWEALTNSKPGTLPVSQEGRRVNRTPQHMPSPRPSTPQPPLPVAGRG